MRANQYQARLCHCVKWHSIYYRGGLGGETLVILEYAHAGGRAAATALLLRKGVARKDSEPRPFASLVHLQMHAIIKHPHKFSVSVVL